MDIKIAGATTVVPVSYNFSAKERDEETGLYYFGFRYLDPKYSKWLSTDPALGDYIPGAGKGNAQDSGKLPGMGGVFNHINGNLYAYAANNPVKYTDPDGRAIFVVAAIVVWGGNALLFGYGIGAARNDELGFALRHPVIAIDVGKYKHGSTNISTNCVRFSTTLGLNERYGANKGEGSLYGQLQLLQNMMNQLQWKQQILMNQIQI